MKLFIFLIHFHFIKIFVKLFILSLQFNTNFIVYEKKFTKCLFLALVLSNLGIMNAQNVGIGTAFSEVRLDIIGA